MKLLSLTRSVLTYSVLFFAMINMGFATDATQCEIGEIEATPTECDSMGYFDLVIYFEYANTGNLGFTIQGNGMVYGTYEYADLPVIITDLIGDGTTFYEFAVKDVEFPDCSNFIEFGIVDCNSGDCAIWNVDIFPQPCDSGFFYVDLGFWHENIGSMGFRVQGNGNNYGNFEYADLPITIGPLEGDGVTEYEFVVIDNEFGECSDWAAIDPVDCDGGGGDCEIGELIIDDHPCDSNGMYYVYFDFDYANVSDSGFALYINYDLYGTYFYEELPIENLGPFVGDGTTIHHFLVRDAETYECAEDKNFGPIDCGSGGDCNIWDVYGDIMPCNESGYFNVYLDFEYENVGDDGFKVQGNGVNYGSFPYDSIPVLIGPLPGDGVTVYEFVVTDNQMDDCSDWTAIDPVDCDTTAECEIGELDITILPCNDDNEFFVLLNFDYANTSDGFSVQGNGMMYGNYLYADLPVEIGPLQGDGTTVYEFAVIDAVNSNCAEDIHIDPVSCDSITEFMNFSTAVISCEGDMYQLEMSFDVVNGGSQGFSIIGNGEVYGSYEYVQLPVTIGPLSTDGSTPYHFIAKDKEDPAFGNWDKLIPFTCQSLGISEAMAEEIMKVYPNPSYGSVIFENLKSQPVTVYVYNSTGALTSSFVMTDTYKLSDLNAGMYYYRIISVGEVIAGGKIIVTR